MTALNAARLAFVALILAIVAFAGYALGQVDNAPVMVAAPVQQDVNTNFCAGGVAWQVGNEAVAVTSYPACGPGNYVLTMEGKENRSFADFAAAETARAAKAGTYWFEPASDAGEDVDVDVDVNVATDAPAAAPTARPTAAPAASGAGAQPGDQIALMVLNPLTARETAALQNFDWEMWLSGGSPIVVSNGRAVGNVGSATSFGVELLADIDLVGLNGTVVVLEPWRAGCGATLKSGIPQSRDPNCNPGAAWLFSSWKGAIDWTIANDWPEYSMWYRPDDVITTDAQKTCVAALVPAGTALNVSPDVNAPWQVCPDGFQDPEWIVRGMANYVHNFCAANPSEAICK